jgi:hypothetical protein
MLEWKMWGDVTRLVIVGWDIGIGIDELGGWKWRWGVCIRKERVLG